MKRTAVFLTEHQLSRLKVLAAAIGIPMAELIRRLLDDGLLRMQKQQQKQATYPRG